MNIYKVSNHQGESLHTSFKRVCEFYGWKYESLIRGGVPSSHDGYFITKVQTDMASNEILLREFLNKPFRMSDDFSQDYDQDHERVTCYLTNSDDLMYQIEVNVSIHSVEDVTSTDRGDLDATEHHAIIDEIYQIYDPQGDEVESNSNTDELIKSKIIIE